MRSARLARLPDIFLAESPDRLRAWVKTAKPGAQWPYARGRELDRQRDTVVLVRRMAAAGLITMTQRRLMNGEFEFLAVRLKDDAEPASRADAGMTAEPPAPDSEAGQVLALLANAARRGAACPTNAEIAAIVGLSGGERARYLLRGLAGAGLVSIENRGPRLTRVVTICATGARTADAPVQVGKGCAGGLERPRHQEKSA